MRNNCSPFLALTALDEYWDTSRHLLFLGEWCRDHNKKDIWKGLDATVLSSTELDHVNSYNAFQCAIGIYEKLLPKLADGMNELHGTKYSLRYWKLLIGPFLFWYTQIIYYRFHYLTAAYNI